MGEELLIADESEFDRRLVRSVVEDDHDVVGVAESGVEAVELAKSREPSVVILDVSLPIKDGIEATAEIVGQGVSGVVVCSAERDEETVESAFEAGADAFVAKPFQRASLLEAIEDAVAP